MIPLFKSSYSFGKSILTFEDPKERPDRSITGLCKENNISTVNLVEDTLHGVKNAYMATKESELNFNFGWRVSCVDDVNTDTLEDHKIIIAPKSEQGWYDFLPIFNRANSDFKEKKVPRVSLDYLKEAWTDNLQLIIPFYDNFIFKNLTKDYNFVVDLDFFNPRFVIEENGHLLDGFIKENVLNYTNTKSYQTDLCKSIFYNKNKDYKAWQTMKMITNRRYGRMQSIHVVGLDFCCSPYFSVESFLENRDKKL